MYVWVTGGPGLGVSGCGLCHGLDGMVGWGGVGRTVRGTGMAGEAASAPVAPPGLPLHLACRFQPTTAGATVRSYTLQPFRTARVQAKGTTNKMYISTCMSTRVSTRIHVAVGLQVLSTGGAWSPG